MQKCSPRVPFSHTSRIGLAAEWFRAQALPQISWPSNTEGHCENHPAEIFSRPSAFSSNYRHPAVPWWLPQLSPRPARGPRDQNAAYLVEELSNGRQMSPHELSTIPQSRNGEGRAFSLEALTRIPDLPDWIAIPQSRIQHTCFCVRCK